MSNHLSSIGKKNNVGFAGSRSLKLLMVRVAKKIMTMTVLRRLYRKQLMDKLGEAGFFENKGLAAMASLSLLIASGQYISGVIFPALIFMAIGFLIISVPVVRILNRYSLPFRLSRKYDASNIHQTNEASLVRLGLARGMIDDLVSAENLDKEVTLAEWDRNNLICSKVGPIRFARSELVSENSFRAREKNKLTLVWSKGRLMVRKSFDDRACFNNEVAALDRLADLSCVPSIMNIDAWKKVLYMEFVEGVNLGLLFVSKGVSVKTQYQESVAGIVSDNTLSVLKELLPDEDIRALQDALVSIHRRGVALRDVKYGNVLLSSEGVKLLDFDTAMTSHRSSHSLFLARSEDLQAFNRLFSQRAATGEKNSQFVQEASAESYAPIYIGKGVSYGKVGSIEFGTGKWSLMVRHLPALKGKRVVDLGSNNGNLPLEMLRAGAKSVKGFELNPSVYQLALHNKALYELVDNRAYDFELNNDYMHGVLNHNLDGFDIATAYCSIYYESPEYMRQITRYLSQHVTTFVVQANENTDEHNGVLLERSSVPYLKQLLKDNGFKRQQVIRWPFYDRPMIIATSDRVGGLRKRCGH